MTLCARHLTVSCVPLRRAESLGHFQFGVMHSHRRAYGLSSRWALDVVLPKNIGRGDHGLLDDEQIACETNQ